MVTGKGKLTHTFAIGDAEVQAAHAKEMQAMVGMLMHDVTGVHLPPGQPLDLVWTLTRAGPKSPAHEQVSANQLGLGASSICGARSSR